MNDLSPEHFDRVLEQVKDQAFKGKGENRHGRGQPFSEQPWKVITDNLGDG